MRECSGCSLCCTLLGIREISKPPDTECPNCSGSGCNIYSTRPGECKGFNCSWLLGDTPEDLKPDKTHVVLADLELDLKLQGLQIEGNRKIIIVTVDPKYPNAHREGKMKDYLNQLLKQEVELIVVTKGEKLYMRWGEV